MKRHSKILLPAILLIISGCSSKPRQDTTDLSYIRDLGYEYAYRYRALPSSASEMERQSFLLDVHARETRIHDEVGAEYAREFRNAFADSAFVDI